MQVQRSATNLRGRRRLPAGRECLSVEAFGGLILASAVFAALIWADSVRVASSPRLAMAQLFGLGPRERSSPVAQTLGTGGFGVGVIDVRPVADGSEWRTARVVGPAKQDLTSCTSPGRATP